MNAIRETVPAALAGERLDRVVALVTGLSRSAASALVADGRVEVDGSPETSGSRRLVEGETIALETVPDAGPAALVPDPTVEFRVVHADDDVVVIDKPAGLVVHPGAGHGGGTLAHGLLARFPEIGSVGEANRPGIVHRLDRGTSGLLLVARTPRAYEGLVEMLSEHRVDRHYIALVWGEPEARRGVVDAPVGRSERDRTRMAVTERGRHARTHYEVRQVFHEPVTVALLDCALETGRTHQIRVHLAAIGHPVVGDPDYRGRRGKLIVPRPMLHAAEIRFTHPVTGEELAFTAPVPADMAAVLASLS